MKKNMRAVAMDILSLIYQSTLRVGSGHTEEPVEYARQKRQAKNLVAKHGISTVLHGLFFAFVAMAKDELVIEKTGVRTGRVSVRLGGESYQLKPYFRGLDAFLYESWPVHADEVKRNVINELASSVKGIDVAWGIEFLNYPYKADRVPEGIAPEPEVKIDLSGMPEPEEGEEDDEHE